MPNIKTSWENSYKKQNHTTRGHRHDGGCRVYCVSPRSIVSANAASTGQQATQEKPLTEEEVSALLEVLKEVVHVRSV